MNSASYQPPSGPFTPLNYQAPASNVATKSRTGYVPPAYTEPGASSSGFHAPAFGNGQAVDSIALANAKTGLFPRTGQKNLSARGNSSSIGSFPADGNSGMSRGFGASRHFGTDRSFSSYPHESEMSAGSEQDSEEGFFSRTTLTSLLQDGRKTYAYLAGIAVVAGGLAVAALSLGGNSDVEPDKTSATQPVDVSTIPSVQISTDPATTMAQAAVSTPSVGAEMLSKMADVYVNNWHFSAARVIQILTNSEVTHSTPAQAQAAIDSLGPVDWNGVALAAAQDGIANDGVPREGVRDYLLSPDIGFTEEQAQFAVDNLPQIP